MGTARPTASQLALLPAHPARLFHSSTRQTKDPNQTTGTSRDAAQTQRTVGGWGHEDGRGLARPPVLSLLSRSAVIVGVARGGQEPH